MNKQLTLLGFIFLCFLSIETIHAQQHSVARQWNEALLDAIRVDIGRPTVHARNLWHTSTAMYDAWAIYDEVAETFLLGKSVSGFNCDFEGISMPRTARELEEARREAISYAAYRLLTYRFQNSPGAAESLSEFDSLMTVLGYDASFTSTDYSTGSGAALGNYIAQCLIDFGLQDNSNEQADYASHGYEPVNPPLDPTMPGTEIWNMNRWQPLSFSEGTSTPFLGPHWGKVDAFSLRKDQLSIHERNGEEYWLYLDPGPPPALDTTVKGLTDDYKWNFALVAVWSGHLDPNNNVMIDISPGALGNITEIPATVEGMRDFYDMLGGGVQDVGYEINPVTGQPYEPNIVPLGDFGRVIAEFWADGPNSETPPGHWFTLLNYVSDHPQFEKRFKGEGDVIDDLEWDIKSYFTLGGAVHDVAVAVWGAKAWYDFIRPISAIRGMAELGQSSDEDLPNYHPGGLPLVEGYIELVGREDPLAGENSEHVGKIKLYAWQGPDHIDDPETDFAGVDWILAENWWPYQRPSFVTPPFAGYISGHSTFSRAAAEVLTLLTGDEYFPGGVGEFHAAKNEYLVFEEGPSMDITLQWAKYRDASDQASLSRLWGGIHPPVDDTPGRLMGVTIGTQAFELAEEYFNGAPFTGTDDGIAEFDIHSIYPNPATTTTQIRLNMQEEAAVQIRLQNLSGDVILEQTAGELALGYNEIDLDLTTVPAGTYFLSLTSTDRVSTNMLVVFKNN